MRLSELTRGARVADAARSKCRALLSTDGMALSPHGFADRHVHLAVTYLLKALFGAFCSNSVFIFPQVVLIPQTMDVVRHAHNVLAWKGGRTVNEVVPGAFCRSKSVPYRCKPPKILNWRK